MKKLKKLLIGSMLSVSFFSFQANADAASTNYLVKSGDTYWKIASRFGVPVSKIKAANNGSSNMIYTGQSISIPASSISFADKELMAKLVHAEALAEPYAGKVAVAMVVLNRMDSPDFPDTVKGVIYQVSNGFYAFTPVKNGQINNTPDAASRRAVNEALALRGTGKGSLFFYNPRKTTSKFMLSRPVTTTIGNHRFTL